MTSCARWWRTDSPRPTRRRSRCWSGTRSTGVRAAQQGDAARLPAQAHRRRQARPDTGRQRERRGAGGLYAKLRRCLDRCDGAASAVRHVTEQACCAVACQGGPRLRASGQPGCLRRAAHQSERPVRAAPRRFELPGERTLHGRRTWTQNMLRKVTTCCMTTKPLSAKRDLGSPSKRGHQVMPTSSASNVGSHWPVKAPSTRPSSMAGALSPDHVTLSALSHVLVSPTKC